MDFFKLILTSLLSVISLFIIAKIMGHKQVAQLDFFDYINGITIGSIAAELATDLETPWKPLVAMLIYGMIAVVLSLATSKFPKIRKYVNGTPTILMNNGKIYRKNMKKAKLDLTAIFEYNGKLTILPKSVNRPVTPADMELHPEPDYINTEIIMDGRIMGENLKRIGLDLKWLEKQIKAQGYHDAKEIFLGLCDNNNRLSLFAVK